MSAHEIDTSLADAVVRALRQQLNDSSSKLTGLSIGVGVGEYTAETRGEIDLFRLAHAIERELRSIPS